MFDIFSRYSFKKKVDLYEYFSISSWVRGVYERHSIYNYQNNEFKSLLRLAFCTSTVLQLTAVSILLGK